MKKIIILSLFLGLMVCNCSKENDLDNSNKINGHEYVDLGLPSGKKWATCNMGANSPSMAGDYYSWGSLNPNVVYSGMYDNPVIEIGGTSYDVAHVKWGGSWHMPNKDELSELISNCEIIWTSLDGMNGCKIIGPNGNSIFLPAAGFDHHDTNDMYSIEGFYWSSTRYEPGSHNAYSLEFSERYKYLVGMNLGDLFSIRPVSN